MGIIIGIIGGVLIASVLAFFWTNGIDHMKENHPNYKGEDFLGDDLD
jgi:hypothetical protein